MPPLRKRPAVAHAENYTAKPATYRLAEPPAPNQRSLSYTPHNASRPTRTEHRLPVAKTTGNLSQTTTALVCLLPILTLRTDGGARTYTMVTYTTDLC